MCKWWGWASGKNIRSKLLLMIEGAVWVELQVAEGNNMIDCLCDVC